MQVDEAGDGVDVVMAEAQRLHPITGHAGADDIVMVERDTLARFVAARSRLTDIVEQRRQARPAEVEVGLGVGPYVLDDGDGVGEDVFMTVDRILLQPHRRQLRQDEVGEPVVDVEPQAGGGMIERQQLVELVANAFGRHDLQTRRHRPARLDQLGIGREVEARHEAGGAQHPQRIVVEADLRRQRRAQASTHEIGGAAMGVDQGRRGAVEAQRHRVDGEVAS